MFLAERIVLTKGIHKEEYELADRAAPLAKLLYNAALFHVRGQRMKRKSLMNWHS